MAVPMDLIGKSLFVATLLVVPGGATLAQEAGAGGANEIIVEAPRSAPLPLPEGRSPFTGAPIVTSTVRIPVFFDDLDLAQPGDDARLMTRVQRVAQDVCRELDRIQPFSPDEDCVSKTIASGTEAAKAAIVAAKDR